MAEAPRTLTPRDVLRIVFRRKLLFALSSVLFSIAMLQAASHLMPRKYSGTAKFKRSIDTAGGRDARGASKDFAKLRVTTKHELAGRDAVQRVADDLALLDNLPHDTDGQLTHKGQILKQNIVRKLMAGVHIRKDVTSKEMDLISVTVTHENPELAQQIPNALVRNYIEQVSESIIADLTRDFNYRNMELKKSERLVNELKRQKLEFETEHAGMMPESPGALRERIQRKQQVLEELGRSYAQAKAKLAQLEALLPGDAMFVSASQNPAMTRLMDEKRRLENELLAMTNWKEKHYKVVALKSRIAKLQELIDKTPRTTTRPTRAPTGYEAQLAAAGSEVETNTRSIKQVTELLKRLQGLMGNFVATRRNYEELADKLANREKALWKAQTILARVEADLAAEKAKRRTLLKTLQAAQQQNYPSSPSLPMMLGGSLVCGLAFGGVLVFLANMWDRSIITTEDAIRYFDAPIHGAISTIISYGQVARIKITRWIIIPVVTLIVVVSLAASAFSVVLWLRYPQEYEAWQRSPAEYLFFSESAGQ